MSATITSLCLALVAVPFAVIHMNNRSSLPQGVTRIENMNEFRKELPEGVIRVSQGARVLNTEMPEGMQKLASNN